jgi:hypothetical protein
MRLAIFMFFFIMYAQILLLFQTWYNNIFGLLEQPLDKPLSLSI